jgi:hypothetical protein
MDVENLLTRSLAVSEKQVHSLAPQTAVRTAVAKR